MNWIDWGFGALCVLNLICIGFDGYRHNFAMMLVMSMSFLMVVIAWMLYHEDNWRF